MTRLTGDVSIGHRSTTYSSQLQQGRDNSVDEFSIGVRYRPGAALTFGAAVRAANGDYPRYFQTQTGQTTSEGYNNRYVDLTADWPISGASAINARISVGKESFDTATYRDFSGVTGSVGWRWQPTGRLSLQTNLSRDAGEQSTLFTGDPTAGVSIVAINQVRNALTLSAGYELTAKVRFTGSLSTYDGRSVNAGTNTVGNDRGNNVMLGVTWAPTRSINVGCDFSRTSRSASNVANGYDANKTGCYGDLTLR